MSNFNKKVVAATKWSTITEVAAKLVTPVSTMILARLLTPDDFGIMITAVMIISFAEIFTDAGFQKYIVQHVFEDRSQLYNSTNVAFWSNLLLSIFLWLFIILFSDEIAYLVGDIKYSLVISVSCICIPIEAFSSIQMALYKKKLDFRTLFIVRIIGVFIPLFVTIPIAYYTHSYWSLIIGMIVMNLSNAVFLTWKSDWKPKYFYSIKIFKSMFSFTFWSMLEAITIWATTYIDLFIVGTLLSQHFLGIYRTSMTMVGQITGLITAATTPVLFSALSKLQNEDILFKKLFYKFQKLVAVLIFPLCILLWFFKDFMTFIVLGSQWGESSYMFGLWALTSGITIVFSHYSSEIYRAKGKPIYSVLVQCSHLLFLVPTIYLSIKYGFRELCEMRALVRFQLIIANLIVLNYMIKINIIDMIKNLLHPLFATLLMSLFLYCFPIASINWLCQLALIIVSLIIYVIVLFLYKEERKLLFSFKKSIIK